MISKIPMTMYICNPYLIPRFIILNLHLHNQWA